ncbi:MAG TPA: 16S rRNA (guanine(527)-N(7))-methyltransferase RsmG [Candidatus Mediterraneibacter merdipullorum]|nr:16S rRNA (guanine(527)-N(7))-methyltransferase RsmG [Candidatus Mediterraneibacter merdipullorum]
MKNLEDILYPLGIRLSERQKEQFDRYYELMTEWNKVMNLTGITEREEVDIKHFADSLTLVRINDMQNIHSMIDVGTGAGFPGIPIKIMYPHIRVVLLDSLNKRLNFLNEVIAQLGLEEISTLHGRAEDHARNEQYREQFDLCVSRAVANLSTLCEYCIPFVKPGGFFISYKGSDADEEIGKAAKASELLGGKISRTDRFTLPETDMGRVLVQIDKIRSTPKKYPRKAGVPSRNPLG